MLNEFMQVHWSELGVEEGQPEGRFGHASVADGPTVFVVGGCTSRDLGPAPQHGCLMTPCTDKGTSDSIQESNVIEGVTWLSLHLPIVQIQKLH